MYSVTVLTTDMLTVHKHGSHWGRMTFLGETLNFIDCIANLNPQFNHK